MALVDLEQFAGFLRRDLSDFDAYTAQQLLDGACALVTEFCGWHIAPVIEDTVTVDGSGLTIQALPSLYLVDVTAVTDNGTALDIDQLDWSTYGVLEKVSGGRWTSRRRGVTADITHGLAATPAWLTTLICAVAGRAMTTQPGVAAESAGGESITYATPYLVPPGAVALLNMERQMLGRLALPTAA